MRPVVIPDLPLAGFQLRELLRTDVEAWYAYLSQASVYRHTSWNLSSGDDLIPLLASYASNDPNSMCRFALIDLTTGALAGTIGFHTISTLNRSAEIAYDIAPDYWGRGLATAACEAVLRWGFNQQGYQRIQATVLPSNLPSQRVLAKCGFRFEGTVRHFRLVRGVPMDFLMYSRLATDAP